MNINLLTEEALISGRAKAVENEKRARAMAARYARALKAAERDRAKERKCLLGALLLAAVARQPDRLPALRGLLLPLVTREADWAALESTPFARQVPNA